MATYGVSFESSSGIEERKEQKRQARQEVLEKAKQQYEKEEKRRELKRQRGEDTWILPEVNQRLQQIEDEESVKSKKKKEKKAKKKKEKKKKVKKQKTTEAGNGSDDSSQDSEEEWVEAQPQKQPAKAWQVTEQPESSETSSLVQNVQRDEWMTFDFLAMKTTSTAERRAEKEQLKETERAKAQAIEQAGLNKLELNPYWKDGGTGLPSEEAAQAAVKKGPVVNDGGLSWLRKSYQRMKEQAEREQRSLSDVVAERYGSMEDFQKRLSEAEEVVYNQRRRDEERSERDGWRRGEEEGRERWRRKEEDRRGRWRRGEKDSSPRDRERGRGGDKEQNRGREERNRDRGKDGDDERDKKREKERERYRDGDRGKDKSSTITASSSSSSSSGQSWKQKVPLKSRFLKPSDDDDDSSAARPSSGLLNPGSDDEDNNQKSSSVQAWKKSSTSSAPGSNSSEKESQNSPRLAEQSGTAAPSRTESESEEDEEEEEQIPLLSEEEMNKLGSKLIKAEILGNTVLVEKLKSQLEAAQKAKESHAARVKELKTAQSQKVTNRSSEDQEVLLFRTDQSGRAWPVKGPSGPQEPHGGRRKKKPIETHVDGQRVRYFQDDDSVGLQEMVRREKMSSAHEQNALYSRMAGKMMGKTDEDNYTLDDMFVSSAAQQEGEGREEERMRSRAVAESRRLAASMDKCHHCFSSQELQKHLIVAIGSKVYLSLPAAVSLTEGHCLICPLQHHCAATSLDEDVWSEMQLFRRALVRMLESQELDCVFMETHMNPRRKQHMVLECIPLPRELGDMAPIYFKKALMECDEEWAMNKRIVDLSSKDVRHSVPRGLPYFAVDFGLQGGFAHVIENEQKFPHYFGKEVVGGMLDLEPRRWRKPIRENFDDQRKKVLQFAQWWKPYDCTKTES